MLTKLKQEKRKRKLTKSYWAHGMLAGTLKKGHTVNRVLK